MNIFLDIETCPLPPEKREFTKPVFEEMSFGNTKDEAKKRAKFDEAVESWEAGDSAAPDATTGEVALIGFAIDEGEYSHFYGDEASILTGFWHEISEENSSFIIGHNVIAFDLPFMIRRSMINRVDIPFWVIQDLSQYNPQSVHDTMRLWQFGDRRHFVSLKNLCGAFGIAVKEGEVTGKNFYEWWAKDKQKCIDYNRQDVEAVREIWKRLTM